MTRQFTHSRIVSETEIDLQKESPFYFFFFLYHCHYEVDVGESSTEGTQKKIRFFFLLVWKEKWSAEIVICYYDMIWGDDDSIFFYINKKSELVVGRFASGLKERIFLWDQSAGILEDRFGPTGCHTVSDC